MTIPSGKSIAPARGAAAQKIAIRLIRTFPADFVHLLFLDA
jgi:hypothetical protein